MKLSIDECLVRAQIARVGRLATVSGDGQPHAVPVTFARVDESVVIGIDEKPKSRSGLKRLRNIQENPRVALLWDKYDEDWTELWWVRADGTASILERGTTWEAAWAALNEKYQQYEGKRHEGPVIAVSVDRWSGWSYSS